MEYLASELLRQCGCSQPPTSLEILASVQGIGTIRYSPMQGAGRLIPVDGGLLIEVNESHSPGKQRFTIAHEVSHTLIPTYDCRFVDDRETGAFPLEIEEEHLCDIGAAALLLPPSWLRVVLAEGCGPGPSVSSLTSVAHIFESSLEAAARQVAKLDYWPIAFVCWEEGFRKEQRVPKGQMAFDALKHFGLPQPLLRASRVYGSPSFRHFVPPNKSVEPTSLVGLCGPENSFTCGVEEFVLGKGVVTLYCENLWAPYRKNDEVHTRVFSMLSVVETDGDRVAKPVQRQLEVI